MPSRWVKVKTFKSLSTSKLEKKLQNFKSYNSFDIIEIKRHSYFIFKYSRSLLQR